MVEFDLGMGELLRRLPRQPGEIAVVDSHTAGESTRVVLGGMPAPPKCESIADIRLWMQREADHARRLVTREPRGHRDIVGAWITAPRAEGADFGVVFMDAKRYPFACGTATVGAITTMIELGLATPRGERGEVVVDTPAGLVRAYAQLEGPRVRAVVLELVPSCVLADSVSLELAGGKRARACMVFVGGCLALVSTSDLQVPLAPDRATDIVAFGDAVVAAANDQHALSHPITGEAATVDGCVLYDPGGDAERRGAGAVVYGASHLDRSPCGTGTAAKMTRLFERGELSLGERYENRGILGTSFEGWLTEEVAVGSRRGVRAQIQTSAQLVGLGALFLDPADPFPDGYLLPP